MPQLPISDLLKNQLVRKIAIGAGVAVAIPLAVTYLAPLVRPVARSTVKAGLVIFEKARETTAEIGEIFEDMVAEVREDLRQKRALPEEATINLPNAEQVTGEIDRQADPR